ncbi:MAG: NADP-dependent phosphogluconate dehydrogenase [candidate division KSB1 bacterium]|nr:NADP-dependent phosphogluconate dehydrogenase [candidate division KSB1 bacterium]MDZ7393753.1 NADP-dependent phosphogluconate dehydrogenase [candidate division KSB1 bacterium]
MDKQDFGIIGLGVMGQNLALNIEGHGYTVAGFDLDAQKRHSFSVRAAGKNIAIYPTLAEFLAHLASPRRILAMVPAGRAVDRVIEELSPHLAAGDILIDGGNSHFTDTERRVKLLENNGVLFVGSGISGGEEGALHGPSIMPGGNSEAWPHLRQILQAIAAKANDGTPCCAWIGPGGSGHFVKMVHNGIEYADMQMISEAYFLMDRLLGLGPEEMQSVFAEWNKGELNSYLIEITSAILGKKDELTGQPLVRMILDTAEQKGTGKWTSQVALDLGVPAQTIAEAVFARAMSALKRERLNAAGVLAGPSKSFEGDRERFLDKIREALWASKICSYAQGFQLMAAAKADYGWDLDLRVIASLWRAGCIIRAQFLTRIMEAYHRAPDLPNLLLDDYFREQIEQCQDGWREVVATAVAHGLPCPAFASALAYFDSYRTPVLPANLIQAQRDYFGAHTYRRVDREGVFHTIWTEQASER